MDNDRERVISVTLSEAEWRAFVARQPQPVTWLRERIRAEAAVATTDPQQAQPRRNARLEPSRDSGRASL